MSVILRGKNPRKPHTVRYWVEGRQRERSFATAREAQDFKIKTDHDTRAQIFVDDKLGREDFGAAVDAWIDRHAVTDATKDGYRVTARAWVKMTFAGRSIAQVANDRDRVADLLARDMGHLSITKRRQARTIITGTLDEAVRAGKLAKHSLHGIELKDNGRAAERSDLVFPSHEQVGRGEYRDVVVPGWLWQMVRDLPGGPLCPGNDRPYALYETVRRRIQGAAKGAGIPAGFRPHSLRHAFASALLSRGVPITDVARWMGHKDIRETYMTYSHFMPEAEDRGVAVLDAEYAEWSAAA
jgi:integrase